MCKYFYAIYQPHSILGSGEDELHRFTSPAERDRWVNVDLIHRKTILRSKTTKSGLFDVFNYPEQQQVWKRVDAHEVSGGVVDGAECFESRRRKVETIPEIMAAAHEKLHAEPEVVLPKPLSVSVRGKGAVRISTVLIDGDALRVTWITTPHDTAIIVGSEVAAVFEGKLDDGEFDVFVRSILADARYDRLIERKKWKACYDGIRFGELSIAA